MPFGLRFRRGSMKAFDAIILGSGQAANPLAKWLSDRGRQVALVESRFIGGTCINDGCTPTKTLVGLGKLVNQAHRAGRYGLLVNGAVNYDRIKQRKDEVVAGYRKALEEALFRDPHISVFYGDGRFSGYKTVRVHRTDGGYQEITAPTIIINTGATPVIPDITGLQSVPFLTSRTILTLDHRPRNLLIIGGGYIALEFAQLYRRLGSEVTVVEISARLLPREDTDVGRLITDVLEDDGVKVITNAQIRHVESVGMGKIAVAISAGGRPLTLSGSELLVATGRKPNTTQLNLSDTGLEADPNGFIPVNDYLETSEKGIYALGDVKVGPAFTHVSYHDYLVAVDHLSGHNKLSIRDRLVPYCLFTDPELGRIGITEMQAREAGLDFSVAKLDASAIARAVETGETRGFLKAIVDNKTEQILGVAALCVIGGELMSLLQIAMEGGLSYKQLRDNMFAHPTYAEAINNLFHPRNIKAGK